MRIRTLKPSFYSHEKLSALPAEWHMLAGALLNYADDHGYFNANPALVKAGTMPLRDFDVMAALRALASDEVQYLRLGTAPDGRLYGHVLTFHDHQRVDRPRASTIAALAVEWGHSTTPRRGLDDVSTEEKEKEWNRKRNRKRNGTSTHALRARFDAFWAAYPNRKGKDAAWAVWQKLHPDAELHSRILAAIDEQRRSPQWLKDGGAYIPYPKTWLNQGRWDDEPVQVPVVSARNVNQMKAIYES